jgi:hypothetical protein
LGSLQSIGKILEVVPTVRPSELSVVNRDKDWSAWAWEERRAGIFWTRPLRICHPKGTRKSIGWWSWSLSTWFKTAITGRDPHFRTHAFATWCTDTAVALKDRESNSESVFKRILSSPLTGGLPQFHGQWICSSRLCRPSIWSKWCHTQLLRPWKREREATVACPESIFLAKWRTAGLKVYHIIIFYNT